MSNSKVKSLQDNSDADVVVPPAEVSFRSDEAPAAQGVLFSQLKANEVDGGTICIQGLSVFGHNHPKASPNGTVQVRPSSIPAGSVHTISAEYAAKVLDVSLDDILDSASHGKVFCSVAWTFPNHQYPRFTTRHLVVPGDAADISFSGGLGWALKQLSFIQSRGKSASPAKAVQPRRPPGTTVHVKRPARALSLHTFGTGSPGPLQSANGPPALARTWSEPLRGIPLPPVRSLTSSPATIGSGIHAPTPLPIGTQVLALLGSTGLLRDASTPFESGGQAGGHTRTSPPCGHLEKGVTETTTSPEPPLTCATSRQSTPFWDSDDETQQDAATAKDPRIQDEIALLRRKRRAAEVLYEHTGDTSGRTALLRHAAQHSEVWYPSGRPRF
ncbi:hypothetical protein QBC47DRAFT_193354 [Echria macrotheca]|uniref:Uncharacterized protein n=1 Tax=Echria macrotheca TaxID=438768 RepID=A0AAJ0BCU9_9PEZI|nr:hypothetical protein QBC47DRAFT_193354 [Echria macrotheca]